ncbi:hypothetical protein WMY93_026222 [Mugilogobius chulae]|uniref:THAP-type domain-containing protein n=1 Tax=Mugilogobius chulae TaxID=88201 RepID=A0AAW0N739_9GOBI
MNPPGHEKRFPLCPVLNCPPRFERLFRAVTIAPKYGCIIGPPAVQGPVPSGSSGSITGTQESRQDEWTEEPDVKWEMDSEVAPSLSVCERHFKQDRGEWRGRSGTLECTQSMRRQETYGETRTTRQISDV